jgi:endonuclease/exonuclease/phosphatase family metal-dependent hydrolase
MVTPAARSRCAAVALVALLSTLLSTLAALPTDPSTAAYAVAGEPAAGAQASGDRARPITRRVVALTANIHGGTDRRGRPNPHPWETVRRAMDPGRQGRLAAQLVLVNEVCSSQVENLRRVHPSWEFLFFVENGGAETACPGDRPSGNVIGSRHDLTGATRVGLPTDPSCSDAHPRNDHAVCDVRFSLGCAFVSWGRGTGRSLRACVTHLMPGWSQRRRHATRREQTARIRAALAPSLANGTAIVLGGDFNTLPGNVAMDDVYDLRGGRFGGPGAFDEVDQVDSGTAARRSFPGARPRSHRTYTHHRFRGFGDRRSVARDKFDYLFFSQNSVDGSPRAPRPLYGRVLANPYSDHDVLLGAATVTLTG